MAIVEKIKEMQEKGISNEEINRVLSEQGFSPKQINEGLSQANIKQTKAETVETPEQTIKTQTTASPAQTPPPAMPGQTSIQPETSFPAQQSTINPTIPKPITREISGGMQPSIMEQQPAVAAIPQEQPSNITAPQAAPSSETPAPQIPEQPTQQYPEQAPQQTQYTKEGYEGYGQADYNYPEQYEDYPEYGAYPEEGYGGYEDTSIINEIAEQVVLEKTEELVKGIDKLIDFKNSTETQLNELDARLKKIEKSFSELQSSILRRIGRYTQDVGDIKTELKTMQGSFSKLVNPLTDNIRQLEEIAQGKTKVKITKATATKPKKRKKSPEQIRKLRLKNLEKARKARKKKSTTKKSSKKRPRKTKKKITKTTIKKVIKEK